MIIKNRYKIKPMRTTKCSECGADAATTQQESLPDGGFMLTPREWGYYGGFTDNLPWESIKEEEEVILCHDCSLRLVRAFPSIAKAIGAGGHHPCDSEVPCCEFSWRGTKDFGKNDGEKHVRTQRPVVDETTGNLKWKDDEPQ